MTTYLKVTAKQEGFRRAGRAWSTTPAYVPAAELGEMLDSVLEEQMLVVEELEFSDLPAEEQARLEAEAAAREEGKSKAGGRKPSGATKGGESA